MDAREEFHFRQKYWMNQRERICCFGDESILKLKLWVSFLPVLLASPNGVLDLTMPCVIFLRMRQQWEKVRMGHLLQALAESEN